METLLVPFHGPDSSLSKNLVLFRLHTPDTDDLLSNNSILWSAPCKGAIVSINSTRMKYIPFYFRYLCTIFLLDQNLTRPSSVLMHLYFLVEYPVPRSKMQRALNDVLVRTTPQHPNAKLQYGLEVSRSEDVLVGVLVVSSTLDVVGLIG